MSKSTTSTCDGCGVSQTGSGYATLWPKLKRMGWTADNTRHVHFCKKCAALRKAQGRRHGDAGRFGGTPKSEVSRCD